LKKIFLLTIVVLFLVSGCVKEMQLKEPATTCDPPRIMYKGECCLDADNSGVCDVIEEALKRAEQIKEAEEAEVTEEKIADQCIDMSSWFECEDVDIMYDGVLDRGLIKLQLKNNREGIVVIKKFKFSQMPLCDKELSWGRDETGILPGESSKYTIECNALKDIDVLETVVEMDVNFYEKVTGQDPWLEPQYSKEVEQTIKGTIKGST